MKIINAFVASGILIGFAGCSPMTGSRQGDGAVIGTATGAIIGGLLTERLGIGGQIAGVVGGGLIGGMVGAQIGAYLDEQDRQALEEMMQFTASTNSPKSYVNSKTGVRITTRVVKRRTPPQQPLQVAQKQCKSIEQKIVLGDGTEKQEIVSSCRGANGTWMIA